LDLGICHRFHLELAGHQMPSDPAGRLGLLVKTSLKVTMVNSDKRTVIICRAVTELASTSTGGNRIHAKGAKEKMKQDDEITLQYGHGVS
jgi:hypothetical protein